MRGAKKSASPSGAFSESLKKTKIPLFSEVTIIKKNFGDGPKTLHKLFPTFPTLIFRRVW